MKFYWKIYVSLDYLSSCKASTVAFWMTGELWVFDFNKTILKNSFEIVTFCYSFGCMACHAINLLICQERISFFFYLDERRREGEVDSLNLPLLIRFKKHLLRSTCCIRKPWLIHFVFRILIFHSVRTGAITIIQI